MADTQKPGAWYVTRDCKDVGKDYLRQVVNFPKREETDEHGITTTIWKPLHAAIGEHFFDCEVYARAVAQMLVDSQRHPVTLKPTGWNAADWPRPNLNKRSLSTSQKESRRRRELETDLSAR